MFNFRRVSNEEDYDKIIELQAKYLITQLSQEEQKGGFLSVAFTKNQFKQMDEEAAVVLCEDEDKNLIGYRGSSTPKFNQDYTLPAKMIEKFPQIYYKQKVLSDYVAVIPGPVCVDSTCRGKGIGTQLRETLISFLPSTVNMLITFVSSSNRASLNNNLKHGFEKLDSFNHSNEQYTILGKLI